MGSLSTTSHALGSPSTSPKSDGREPTDLNVRSVVLGDILFDTWYPSFYAEELVGRELDRLHVCPWCFKYTKEVMFYLAHLKSCPAQVTGPPGQQIYQTDHHSIYEVDGEEHQLFAQNLSLFAKLFLDNKSVFYDVSSFNYYLLLYTPTPTTRPTPTPRRAAAPPLQRRQQIIGFFSKEKMSWDNNNLACILIFPPWQRKGLGQILMGASYHLSRLEGRFGGPEKPLSELGRRGYMQFWQARVARWVLGCKKGGMSVRVLAERCWVLPEDVVGAVREMGVVGGRRRGGGGVVVSKKAVREWVDRCGVDLRDPVCEEGFSVGGDDDEDEEDDEEEEV